MKAVERCACGASIKVESSITNAVATSLDAFRRVHAPCRRLSESERKAADPRGYHQWLVRHSTTDSQENYQAWLDERNARLATRVTGES